MKKITSLNNFKYKKLYNKILEDLNSIEILLKNTKQEIDNKYNHYTLAAKLSNNIMYCLQEIDLQKTFYGNKLEKIKKEHS